MLYIHSCGRTRIGIGDILLLSTVNIMCVEIRTLEVHIGERSAYNGGTEGGEIGGSVEFCRPRWINAWDVG